MFIFRFRFKNNDVLFENNMLQISCKSEYRKNMGRLTLTYLNKTPYAFQNFLTSSDTIGTSEIRVIATPCDAFLSPNGQIQQVITVECLQEFNNVPILNIQYT